MGAIQQMLLAEASTTPGVTYATWNPSDKDAGITLSNGNLTSLNNTASKSVRSTIGKTTGKWYWEVYVVSAVENDIGVANGSFALTNYLGNDANGVGYDSSDGKLYKSNAAVASGGSTYSAGSTLGFALDVDAGTLKVYNANTLQYTYTYVFSGTIYAAVGGFAINAESTANFGATAFTYSPPGGYNSGLYT